MNGRLLLALGLAFALAGCAAPGTPYERGGTAFAEGELRTARVELLNAIQADPGDVRARLMLARVAIELGDGAAAESELGRIRAPGANGATIAAMRAHARLLQGDAQGALDILEATNGADPAYAARVRALALWTAGDGPAAQAEFDRALALAPRDSRAWGDLARFCRAHGDVAGAIGAADRAIALDPRDARTLVLRGELTRGQYGMRAALAWFDRALEIDPGHVGALLERAITYGELGRMRDMLADVREVHSLTGGHPTAFFLQAVLAARARNFTLARAVLSRTVGTFDHSPAGMLLLGAIDYETGNVSQAARRLSRLVENQPGNRRARRLLAAAHWRAGDARAVVATLGPLVARPDADAYSLALMGRALDRLGERAEASIFLARAARPRPDALSALEVLSDRELASLRRAADANPGDGPLQVRLVSALLARGAQGEALGRARQLQRVSPGAPQAHVLVGDALGIRGEFAAAAEQYRRAANLAFTEPIALRLIEALQRSGQQPAAEAVLDLFVRQNPRNISGQILHGARLMRAADWDNAIRVYEGLRSRVGDNDATILNNLAWAYSESGDHEAAIPLARRAWALDRNNPATADTLGWILFKSGRDRVAGLGLLERAARGAPNDGEIRRRLDQARRG